MINNEIDSIEKLTVRKGSIDRVNKMYTMLN